MLGHSGVQNSTLGLMRCLQIILPQSDIRVNAMFPWFVDATMTAGIIMQRQKVKLLVNMPVDIASVIADVATEMGFCGNALLVEGRPFSRAEIVWKMIWKSSD